MLAYTTAHYKIFIQPAELQIMAYFNLIGLCFIQKFYFIRMYHANMKGQLSFSK